MTKTILIIAFSNLATDPRVNRQIRFLRDTYRVIAVGLAHPEVEGVEFIPVTKVKKSSPDPLAFLQILFHRYDHWYWQQKHVIDAFNKLSNVHADLILANDLQTLPLALKVAKGAKVILDAHEYAPREYEDVLSWRLLFQNYATHLCRKYIPQVHGMTTICEGIAEAYEKETGIKPVVLTSGPDFEDLRPHLLDEHQRVIRLIHHGVAGRSRKIENMIKMMDDLNGRFELNLMLVESDPSYFRCLKRIAQRNSRIRFLPPVPMRSLPAYLNQFDVGVFLIEPTNFNYRYTLPNKLFEFIQARLAIAIGPSPEMARIVREYDLGVISEDFSPKTFALSLSSLDREKINHYKLRSHRIARMMSAEKNKEILLDLVRQVLGE
jgi:hypothetical protein